MLPSLYGERTVIKRRRHCPRRAETLGRGPLFSAENSRARGAQVCLLFELGIARKRFGNVGTVYLLYTDPGLSLVDGSRGFSSLYKGRKARGRGFKG